MTRRLRSRLFAKISPRRWVLGVGCLLLFGYAARTLVRDPCLGVADIQDFWRVMAPAGIDHVEPLQHPGYYVRCQFQTRDADLESAPSSSALLAWMARHLRWGLSPGDGGMDLRQMGLLCLALVLVIVVAGIAAGLSAVTALLLLYVLVDPGYLLFFNSFYADGALFISLLGVTIWLERLGGLTPSYWHKSWLAWGGCSAMLVVLAFLGGASKMQYVLLPAVLLAAIGGRLIAGIRRSPVRVLLLAGALLATSTAVFWNFFFGPGPRFLTHNNYHAVYGGILSVSSEPGSVLEELGVPGEYLTLPRTDFWSAGMTVDHPVHQYLQDLSRARLLKLYLTDPAALGRVWTAIVDDLVRVESHPRGNRVRGSDSGRPIRRTYQTPWQFSKLSRTVLGIWRPLIGWLLAAAAIWIVAGICKRRWNGTKAAMLFLLLWACSQFVVAVLGEGLINLHQHLVGARLAIDLLIVLLVVDVSGIPINFRRAFPRRSPPPDAGSRTRARRSPAPAGRSTAAATRCCVWYWRRSRASSCRPSSPPWRSRSRDWPPAVPRSWEEAVIEELLRDLSGRAPG